MQRLNRFTNFEMSIIGNTVARLKDVYENDELLLEFAHETVEIGKYLLRTSVYMKRVTFSFSRRPCFQIELSGSARMVLGLVLKRGPLPTARQWFHELAEVRKTGRLQPSPFRKRTCLLSGGDVRFL